MRKKLAIVGAIAVCMMYMSTFSAIASTNMADLNEPILMAQTVNEYGIGVDANLYLPAATWYTGGASNVAVDWSDDLLFQQWPAGAKVRTEVILHAGDAAVFTMLAHFKIEKIDPATGAVIQQIWSGRLIEAYWIEKKMPVTAYTCEINELGLLLYGYNWDTRGLAAGSYKLTFWLAQDADFPQTYKDPETLVDTGMPIVYHPVTLGSLVDGTGRFATPTLDSSSSTSLVIQLLAKTTGRK
ncbi:MAG: hypothetical protein MUC90_04510 [Thermoplasmata archaeon]|nr:hypothetical protein [Thermoplasmata archaeon]